MHGIHESELTISESSNNSRNPNWNLTELQLAKHAQWENKETETIAMEKGRERKRESSTNWFET